MLRLAMVLTSRVELRCRLSKSLGERPSTTSAKITKTMHKPGAHWKTAPTWTLTKPIRRNRWARCNLLSTLSHRNNAASLWSELGRPQELAPTYGCCQRRSPPGAGGSGGPPFRARRQNLIESASCHFAKEAYDLAPNDALATLSFEQWGSRAGATSNLFQVKADLQLERALALDPWLAYAVRLRRRRWCQAYFGQQRRRRSVNSASHIQLDAIRTHDDVSVSLELGRDGVCWHLPRADTDRAALWVQSGVRASPGSFWAQRIAVAATAPDRRAGRSCRLGRQLMRKDP